MTSSSGRSGMPGEHATRESLVSTALLAVGVHRFVPIEVLSVTEANGPVTSVSIELNLHYRSASPVCCPEPGCYTPFLGRARGEVPAQVAAALGLGALPRVSIVAHLVYEPGYAHTELGSATPCSLEYPPEHFGSTS